MPRIFLAEQSAVAVGGHYYAYTRTIALGARAMGLDVTILQNRRFTGDWGVPGASILSAFQHTWAEAEHMWLREWAPGNIAYDFRSAVAAAPPVEGDHVLFSTLSFAELRALLGYFIELPPSRRYPTYHVLLRYDPEVLEHNLEHYRGLFQRIKASPFLRRIVKFHTDTDLLSAAYERLTQLPFTTLPIPFAHDHLEARLAQREPPREPLVITYLGDARIEKNFGLLPAAAAHLWENYLKTGRARLVLQSNFNSEGGEPGMLQAVQKLGQYPPNMIELIDRPMAPEAYYTRLADADIVLAPYQAERYRARSSGVLIEAMAAGKPVVTSRGSWMETQVNEDHAVLFGEDAELGAAIVTAIDDFARLQAGAEKVAPDFMAWSGGENFMKALVATVQEAASLPVAPPRVLCIVDGEALVLRNGASVIVHSQLRYLQAAGYRISVVALMGHVEIERDKLEQWTAQVCQRLAGIDLEGVFLAGEGRLSADVLRQKQRRRNTEFSVGGDASAVAGYDVNLALIEHLRQRAPDVILLNYIVNWPLIEALGLENTPVVCETLDVQAFQKAIYGQRRISGEDLAVEKSMLARCRHLISISSSETLYLENVLPEMPITTVGVFPELRSLDYRSLAGATSLAEVVASCQPTSPEYQWTGAGECAGSEELKRLTSQTSLDLIYVSSNHTANISGLRWFLENVYIPFLAPAGVTMAIAGSISEWGNWPVHKNLFVLGRLTDLDPLYAAARIVVLPITEGAGAAVKTLEALAYGCPTVATSAAMRGIVGEVDGVIVADTPADMRAAIQSLLSSAAERQAMGTAARLFAKRVAGPDRYAALLDGVFADVLGPRARSASGAVQAESQEVFLSWDRTIEHANRLARQWLSGRSLDRQSLAALAALPSDQSNPVLEGVLEALIVNRDAFILEVDKSLLKTVAPLYPEHADLARRSICTAMEIERRRGEAVKPARAATIVFDAKLPLSIAALDAGPVSWRPMGGAELTLEGAPELSLLEATAPAQPKSRVPMGCGSLETGDLLTGAVLSQDLLRGDGQDIPLKREDGSVLLHAGEGMFLSMPEFFSPSATGRSIDFAFEQANGLDLEVRIDGRRAGRGRQLQAGERQIFRFELPDFASGQVEVALVAVTGSGVLKSIVSRLILGASGLGVLARLDERASITPLEADKARASGQAAGETGRQALEQLAARGSNKRPPSRLYLAAMRSRIAEDGDVSSELRRIADQSRNGRAPSGEALTQLALLLDPASHLTGEAQEAGHEILASSGLTMEVHAVLAPGEAAQRLRCLVDGRPARLVENGERAVWRLEGKPPAARDTWLRRIKLVGPNGRPVYTESLDVVFRFVAGRDRTTKDEFVELTNAHDPMFFSDDVGLVWTGPTNRSRFTAPLLADGGKIKISVGNLGENRDVRNLSFELNGVLLDPQIRVDGERADVTANVPVASQALAVTELVITAARVASPPGDRRRLGVALDAIEFTLPLSLGAGASASRRSADLAMLGYRRSLAEAAQEVGGLGQILRLARRIAIRIRGRVRASL